MSGRRTPLGSCDWDTALLCSLLLLHVIPLFTHGSSELFNATQFNSSTSAAREMAVKSALPGEATPIFQAQVLVRKPREGEEPGSGGPGEHTPSSITPHVSTPLTEVEELAAVGGMAADLPTRTGSRAHGRAQLDFKEEDSEDSAPHWQSEVLQADGRVLAHQPHGPGPSQPPPKDSRRPGDGHVINVEFYESDRGHQIDTPPPPRPQELQGGDPTSWTSDFYDYLSPDYSTTEAYPDEDPPTPVYMEDENLSSNHQPFAPGFGAAGYDPAGPAEGGSACLPGFVYGNGTCQSVCDSSSSYCFNGGQCYTTGAGAFCRCNLQEYTWSKGSRCESVITDFQVMCFVVGGASGTVLLLFMVIVFFSKRLHVLKTENRRLRKRRSRPQSEQHVDTFSLSTAAEGSQTNKTVSQYTWEYKPREEQSSEDDTGKQEEPVPTKEDEALNIQNSLTPPQENNKASYEAAEEAAATTDELFPCSEAEVQPSPSTLFHSTVLCQLPKSPPKSPVLRQPTGRLGHGRPLSQVYPRRGSDPGYSPVGSRSLPHLPPRTASPRPGEPSKPQGSHPQTLSIQQDPVEVTE
ncbi:chondroitin sulfate proteoglycan 5b isoform X2 [Brachyhypopomus gauderio]|uniref:chondroitin sulfate proteoglycan 5b isoform X2 n=1 Tax=Brachyhypopomus gauderio TaxID=698409 RepID=UPI0040431B13